MTTNTALKGGYYPGITIPYDEPVELYHNALSSCSQKVRICLAEKEVPFRSHHIHLIETGGYETCSPAYKKINPGACVPTLVHEGHPIYESSDQILYIDKHFGTGPTLTPPGMEQEIAKWVKFCSITADPRKNPSSMETGMGNCIPGISLLLFVTMIAEIPYREIFWGLRHHPNKERPLFFILFKLLGASLFRIPLAATMVSTSCNNLRKHLQHLEQVLEDGRQFICGDEFTLADVAIMSSFARMRLLDFDFLWDKDLPKVTAYFARLEQRPSYRIAILEQTLPIMDRGALKIKELKRNQSWVRTMIDPSPKALVGGKKNQ